MESITQKDKKWIVIWLFIGLIMVFVQIFVGGITRLTGSGLSITKWDIVTGAIPPLTGSEWQESFDLYKQTPQYQRINEGMSLSAFKFIFFWEYIHRLWARTMGFVFLFPFLIFLFRKSLRRQTIMRLGLVVFLAAVAALFGWIMVASGLVERPWVNAYKLTVHLSLGILLFLTLFYTWFSEKGYKVILINTRWKSRTTILIILVVIQICFGGFVSGMKSALNYPTWPLMNQEWIPSIILEKGHWNMDNILLYDKSGFMPALVQLIHRTLAYLITILVLIFSFGWIKNNKKGLHWIAYVLVSMIIVQVVLGIMILIKSIGSIPVFYGVFHQAMGILMLTYLIYIRLRVNYNYK